MPLPAHKVTICGIPELPQHCAVGVTHVLSIIDTHEPRPPALDGFEAIEHELIRFDDVVAEYPGFEACTPGHIEQVLAFGERVHAAIADAFPVGFGANRRDVAPAAAAFHAARLADVNAHRIGAIGLA